MKSKYINVLITLMGIISLVGAVLLFPPSFKNELSQKSVQSFSEEGGNFLKLQKKARGPFFSKTINFASLSAIPIPSSGAESFADSFYDNFILEEAGSISESLSNDWWVNSGGLMIVSNGSAKTIQGDLATSNRWYTEYLNSNPIDTDNGIHPQNIFRLVQRSGWGNFSQESYFKINKHNLSASPNRNQSNGLLLFNRYQGGESLYYTGIRVDGTAVIKKKINGTYYTMNQPVIFAGTYNKDSNPNLIPQSVWIGLRSEVITASDNTVSIKLYMDNGRMGNWTLIAQAVDNGSSYGGVPILTDGYGGIRTDFMDVEFSDYKISILAQPASSSSSSSSSAVSSSSATSSQAPSSSSSSTAPASSSSATASSSSNASSISSQSSSVSSSSSSISSSSSSSIKSSSSSKKSSSSSKRSSSSSSSGKKSSSSSVSSSSFSATASSSSSSSQVSNRNVPTLPEQSNEGGGGGGGGGGGNATLFSPQTTAVMNSSSESSSFADISAQNNLASEIKTEEVSTENNNKIEPNEVKREISSVNNNISVQTTSNGGFANSNISSDEFISKKLSIGIRDENIKILQSMLSKDGEIYPEGLVTGFYGPVTVRAVQRFQRKYNIIANDSTLASGFGLAGPKTRRKLIEIYGSDATVKSPSSTSSAPAASNQNYLMAEQKNDFIITDEQVEILKRILIELMEKR